MFGVVQPRGFARNERKGDNQHQPTKIEAQKWRPSIAGTWRGGRTRRHKADRVRPKVGCLRSLILAAVFDRRSWRAQPAREERARPHSEGNRWQGDADGEGRWDSSRSVRLADKRTTR